MKHVFTVSESDSPRLDIYLSRMLTGISRTRIQRLIKSGHVSVDGTIKTPKYLVSIGESIEVVLEMETENQKILEPVDIPLEIIYEDENVIVLDKPGGIVVHPGAGNRENTLVHGLLYHFKELSSCNGLERPGIVHRLDKETSGVMIIAKNNKAHFHLARQFEKKNVSKVYVGITWGVWDSKEGYIEGYISRRAKDPTSYELSDKGRISQTAWKVLDEGRYLSAVEFYPKTGRTHQIRVHAASRSHPIFADNKYGGGENRTKGFLPEVTIELKKELKTIQRHALHAHKLSICLPGEQEPRTFSAGIPYDMSELFSKIQSL